MKGWRLSIGGLLASTGRGSRRTVAAPGNAGPTCAPRLTSVIAANGQLDGALGRLLALVENYPQLKSNENFLRLQDELAEAASSQFPINFIAKAGSCQQ